jgi:hypothetical protein
VSLDPTSGSKPTPGQETKQECCCAHWSHRHALQPKLSSQQRYSYLYALEIPFHSIHPSDRQNQNGNRCRRIAGLRGLTTPGLRIPAFEELVDITNADIPMGEGVVLLLDRSLLTLRPVALRSSPSCFLTPRPIRTRLSRPLMKRALTTSAGLSSHATCNSLLLRSRICPKFRASSSRISRHIAHSPTTTSTVEGSFHVRYRSRTILRWCSTCPAARNASERTEIKFPLATPLRGHASSGIFRNNEIVAIRTC